MVKLAEVEDEVEQDTVVAGDPVELTEPVQLVVISDIHVNPWSQFASGTGLSNSRMQQTLEVLDQSLRDAAERDRVWLCAGDLFHTSGRVKNEVLNATVEVLSRYPEVRKLIVFGNHDSRSRGASEVETEETAIRTLCEAVDNCRLLHRDVENLSFPDRGVLSIYGEGAQTRPSNLQVTPPRPADVGIFHQLVDGSLTPKGRTLEGDVLEKDLSDPFHLTIVGDVHHPQYRWEDGDLFLVPGAPEQHNFGDEGDERGWWIVEMEMGRDEDGWHPSDLTFRESDSPRFVTVESQDEVDPEANAFYRVQGGTVDEDTLPTNAEVLGSPPTTVKQRDVLVDGAGLRDTLLAWMEEVEPDGDRADYLERAETLLEDADHAIPRPARLKTVEARDFGSYRDLSYDIRGGVNLIVGDSRDYDSNGAGKSTLIEVIYYALFGETTKGKSAGREIRDERAGEGSDSCMVRLEIDVDGQDVVVIRERSPSGPSLEVQIDGEDLDDDEEITGSSIREMTDALGNLLGLTPEIYKALAYYSQIDTLRLSESTDAERKDLLSELCGLQSFERASSAARSEAKEIDQAIGRTRERIARDQSDLEEAEERLEQKREEAASWEEEHSEKIEKAEDELAYLEDTARAEVFGMRDRLSSIRSRADDLKDLWRERREAEQDDLAERLAADRREDLEERLVGARPDVDDGRMERAREMVESMGEIKERLSEASQALDERKSDWEAAKSDVRNLKREAKKRRRAVEEAEAMEPGDECPECGQDLDPDHVDKVRSQAEERRDVVESNLKERRARARGFKERVDEAKEKVERLEHRLGECQSAEKFLVKVERQREKVQSLEERLEEVEEAACEKAASRINNRILRDEARIDSLVERAEAHVREAEQYLEQRISRTEDRLEALEEQENPHESAVEELESRVEGLESRIESAESGLEGKREEQRIYEYWADGLSKRGVQGLLLEEIAAEFNRTRSRVFPLLTGGRFDVQFSTTSETQAGEKREKTEFVIRDRGMEIEYADLSGGERRRVDLGVMICLSLATARMHGIPGVLGLQIYDEVFGFLDDVGAETVVEVLEEITDTIPSIYVITQDDGMRAHFDQVIEVRQGDDGISRVA